MRVTTMIEIDASEWFDSPDSAELRFCTQHAQFTDPTELGFILFVGNSNLDAGCVTRYLELMKKEGCDEEFIDAFEDAARIGAHRILFQSE